MQFIKNSIFWFGSLMIALLALLIFIFIPVERQSLSAPAVTRIYYADNISPAHQAVINSFNKRYQGSIEVAPVHLPFSKFSTNERKEILARALRSRSERLDVFAVDLIWAPRFARWGQPLDLYFNKNEISRFNSEAMKSCIIDNQLVAIPLYLDVGLMYYRRDILQNLPDFETIETKLKSSISWNEFIALGKRLSYLNKPFYLFAANSYEGLICSFHETMSVAAGEQVFTPEHLVLNTDEARRGLQMLTDMIHRFGLTPGVVTSFDEYKCYLYAMQSDAIFMRGWPGFLVHYKELLAASGQLDKYAMAALPHFEGNSTSAVFGGWNLMVSKFSPRKTEAIRFIKFTQEKENQELMYEVGGYIPTSQAVYEDSVFLKNHAELSYYSRLLSLGKHRPYRQDYTRISDIVSHYLNLAIKNEMSVEDALKQAAEKVNSKQAFIK